MRPEQFLTQFDRISGAPDAIPRLRRFILDLAIMGKLVEQDVNDEPASELLVRVQEEKARLVKAGEIRKERPQPPLSVDDHPFSLPVPWKWSKLAEIGFINPRNSAGDNTQASFIPMTLISAEYGVPSKQEIRPWGEIKSGFTHFADGDVALAKITPCFQNGKSTVLRNLSSSIGAGTTELHIVRPLFVDPDYVLIFLKSPHFIETGIPLMTGTAGQKRISTEYFTNAPFPLPPLSEQHRIVAKVDELMALCDRLEAAQAERESRRDRLVAASLNRLNQPADHPSIFQDHARFYFNHLPRVTTRYEHIQQLRQTILNLAVHGHLVPQDPNDEPASELLKHFQAEIQNLQETKGICPQKSAKPNKSFEVDTEIPPSWVHAYLQELAYQISDGTHLTPKYTEKGKPFLSAQNVKPFRFMPEKHRFVSSADFARYRMSRKAEREDVLLTRVGAGIGEAAILDSEFEFAFYVSLCLIKIPTSLLKPQYLVLWLNSPEGRNSSKIRTYGKGASQGNLNLGLIRTFRIPLPPLAEQVRIVAQVEELLALCDRLEAQLRTTQTEGGRLLEAVLNEALTGASDETQAGHARSSAAAMRDTGFQ